jgi:hypothetical protein
METSAVLALAVGGPFLWWWCHAKLHVNKFTTRRITLLLAGGKGWNGLILAVLTSPKDLAGYSTAADG